MSLSYIIDCFSSVTLEINLLFLLVVLVFMNLLIWSRKKEILISIYETPSLYDLSIAAPPLSPIPNPDLSKES